LCLEGVLYFVDQIRSINNAAREGDLDELKKLKEQYKVDLKSE